MENGKVLGHRLWSKSIGKDFGGTFLLNMEHPKAARKVGRFPAGRMSFFSSVTYSRRGLTRRSL